MTKVLRPVSTFEQLVNLPSPQLTFPERNIEVSKPDPNVFAFHANAMGDQNNLMAMHAMHNMMMRQQGVAQGADLNVMRDLQNTAAQLNRTMQDIAGRIIPGARGPPGATGPVVRVVGADGATDDTDMGSSSRLPYWWCTTRRPASRRGR